MAREDKASRGLMPEPDPLESLYAAHAALEALKVPHGLIGGWAVIAWGRVRTTRDIDWLADVPAPRRREILGGLSSLGSAEWRAPGEDDPIPGLIRITPADDEAPVIDLLSVAGAADRIALSRCKPVEFGHGPLPAVRVEDIIAMKLQAGGGLDYEDARVLLEAQAGHMDQGLLAAACRERKVSDRLASLTKS